jgi:hypothetical protein
MGIQPHGTVEMPLQSLRLTFMRLSDANAFCAWTHREGPVEEAQTSAEAAAKIGKRAGLAWHLKGATLGLWV